MSKKTKWGNENSPDIVELVKSMIMIMSNRMVTQKSNVHWGSIRNINEAVKAACLQLGKDSNDFNPTVICQGYKCEILLGNSKFLRH